MGQATEGAIDAAARDMGIVPGDPAYPFVKLMLGVADAIRGVPTRMEAVATAQRAPISEEDLRRLTLVAARQMDERLALRMVQFNKAGIAIGVLVALAMGGIGFAAGWFGRGDAPGKPTMAGITGGTSQCEDRPDGSRLCWIPVFERLARTTATGAH